MVGRVALIHRGEPEQADVATDRFVVDLGVLHGLELTKGDFEPVELAIQDSLF
jgi:hypothetical protein